LGASGAWLRAEGLTKLYGGVVALEGASLETRRGEIRGLVGANGAGKSTLVKILTGVVVPTEGRVLVDGRELTSGRPKESLRAGIAAVPQELTVAPAMSVAENVMLGHEPRGRLGLLKRHQLRRGAHDILRSLSLELPPDEPVGRLPLIEQRLVMIARALSINARMVIFDEPTATVSSREVELLLRVIRGLAERDVSVLYVSHRLDEIEQLCDTVTVLRDGRVVAELEHTSRAALVELLVSGTEETAQRREADDRAPGPVWLQLSAISGERLRSVDLDIRAGEIVGLAGLAGSGAREVLLTVCGAVPYDDGRITVGGRPLRSGDPVGAVRADVAFLPGDRSLGTFPNHSVRHNVSLAALRGTFVRRGEERSVVARLLDRVALRADAEAPISSLSGGNQQKALVARWIGAGARVLLLDDPTAGVDVATRPEIHRQILGLRDAGAAVLLVSTDVEELAELADRVVTFDRGVSTGELAGDDLTPARLLAAITKRGAAT
jgi:galactofuranose transport system ATP-binding protein